MLPSNCEELKRIDTILLCGICYEYMETTVITPCSHNYCSLCIRKYLHYKTQCPTCFEEIFEKDLRVNKALDEIKQYFLELKEKLAKCVQSIQNDKLNLSKIKFCEENLIDEKQLNVNHKDISNYGDKQYIGNNLENIECTLHNERTTLLSPSTSNTSKLSTFFTPKRKKISQDIISEKVVICPVCKVNVLEKNINRHLDDCLKREVTNDKPVKPKSKRKPLPKLVLSLMKEGEIKRKLKELGLSYVGDRKVLELRFQRYTTLYNAECDKDDPRSVSELIKQCEEEENLEKRANKLPFIKLQINRNTAENIIEEERKKYLEMHKNSFESLISKIKSTENSQKSSARRSILNENMDSETNAVHSTTCENFYLQDSDSSLDDCPLQMYSSESPMNFLTVELLTSTNQKIKDTNCLIDKEKEEEQLTNTSSGFFHSEIEKTNNNNTCTFVNEPPIISNEVPCSSNTYADTKKSYIEKQVKRKKLSMEETQKKNDNLTETILENYASDFSSNDSVICNSDFETFENYVHDIIKGTDIKENLFIKSNLEKENIKKRKKRRYDNAIKGEENALRKKHKVKLQTNCLSEQNVLTCDGDHLDESYNSMENKFSTKLQKKKEEQLTSMVCTPQRKSNRLRVKNNHSINCDTTKL
ncbi:E3 ubiquitin-protein ligase RAD18-like [Vespa crabro]|uniref:E3 ubiquitin-protein ligase RAD18-like n=1 Tax=Vespa crabro TaxID=7445 RepID=UPI001EFFB694|nr:E3 ubiquitin-protein ligase RAD18-like [Vespa crabro]